MASEFHLTLSDASNLFKIKYEKLSENVYNSANVLLGRVKKSYNFTGKQLYIAIPQSFQGGVGSGILPAANTAKYSEAQIFAKKMYAVVEVDRETIKASLSSEGAFVQATKEVVKKGVESFMRNLSRALFNDGSGSLGLSEAVSNSTTIGISDFKEANLEERDLVDIITESLDVNGDPAADVTVATQREILTVVDHGDGTGAITISGAAVTISAPTNPDGSLVNPNDQRTKIFMQNSKDNDPQGLKSLDATSGKLFGIDVQRRWKAQQKAAAGAAISTDMLNEMMLKIKKASGKSPNLIVCSFKQYEKILNLLEDQKRYTVATRAGLKSKSGADISFSGVEFMSVDGPIGIFPERFVEDDRIYLLNDANIHIYHRPDFGWHDDDGTVFLRVAGQDKYEARYGGYLECYINPCFHGVISGLSV